MRQAITTKLAEVLNGIEAIKEVADYNRADFDKYPAAVIAGSDLEKSRESVKTVLKTFTFTVLIFQPMSKEKTGLDAAEDRLRGIADTLDSTFDADDTLGGVVDDVNLRSAFAYEDSEIMKRVLELRIVCRKLVILT
jgi:hypothetical protein